MDRAKAELAALTAEKDFQQAKSQPIDTARRTVVRRYRGGFVMKKLVSRLRCISIPSLRTQPVRSDTPTQKSVHSALAFWAFYERGLYQELI